MELYEMPELEPTDGVHVAINYLKLLSGAKTTNDAIRWAYNQIYILEVTKVQNEKLSKECRKRYDHEQVLSTLFAKEHEARERENETHLKDIYTLQERITILERKLAEYGD